MECRFYWPWNFWPWCLWPWCLIAVFILISSYDILRFSRRAINLMIFPSALGSIIKLLWLYSVSSASRFFAFYFVSLFSSFFRSFVLFVRSFLFILSHPFSLSPILILSPFFILTYPFSLSHPYLSFLPFSFTSPVSHFLSDSQFSILFSCIRLVHFFFISCSFLLHFFFISSSFLLHFFFISSSFLLQFFFISSSFLLHFFFISSSFLLYCTYIPYITKLSVCALFLVTLVTIAVSAARQPPRLSFPDPNPASRHLSLVWTQKRAFPLPWLFGFGTFPSMPQAPRIRRVALQPAGNQWHKQR